MVLYANEWWDCVYVRRELVSLIPPILWGTFLWLKMREKRQKNVGNDLNLEGDQLVLATVKVNVQACSKNSFVSHF